MRSRGAGLAARPKRGPCAAPCASVSSRRRGGGYRRQHAQKLRRCRYHVKLGIDGVEGGLLQPCRLSVSVTSACAAPDMSARLIGMPISSWPGLKTQLRACSNRNCAFVALSNGLEAADGQIQCAVIQQAMDLVASGLPAEQPLRRAARRRRAVSSGISKSSTRGEAKAERALFRCRLEGRGHGEQLNLVPARCGWARPGRKHRRLVASRIPRGRRARPAAARARSTGCDHRRLSNLETGCRPRDAALLHQGIESHQQVEIEGAKIEVVDAGHEPYRFLI